MPSRDERPVYPFGFRVQREGELWEVSLPHSCDRWAIAGDVNYGEYASQNMAVLELERFIAEAQVALRELREGREHDAG